MFGRVAFGRDVISVSRLTVQSKSGPLTLWRWVHVMLFHYKVDERSRCLSPVYFQYNSLYNVLESPL